MLETVPESDLVDELAEHYSQYRKFMKEGGDKAAYLNCCEGLLNILSELNSRMGIPKSYNSSARTHLDESPR